MADELNTDVIMSEANKRKHFLPINTNTFDRIFISVVVAAAIHLLWLRFLEPAPLSLPLWIASVISIILGFLIFTRG